MNSKNDYSQVYRNLGAVSRTTDEAERGAMYAMTTDMKNNNKRDVFDYLLAIPVIGLLFIIAGFVVEITKGMH